MNDKKEPKVAPAIFVPLDLGNTLFKPGDDDVQFDVVEVAVAPATSSLDVVGSSQASGPKLMWNQVQC
eukprot:4710505-Amphidinium_carterae.1